MKTKKQYEVRFNNMDLGPFPYKDLVDLVEKKYLPLFAKCREWQSEQEVGQWVMLGHMDEFQNRNWDETQYQVTILDKIKSLAEKSEVNENITLAEATLLQQVQDQIPRLKKHVAQSNDQSQSSLLIDLERLTPQEKTRVTKVLKKTSKQMSCNVSSRSLKKTEDEDEKTQFISADEVRELVVHSQEETSKARVKKALTKKGRLKKIVFYFIFAFVFFTYLLLPEPKEQEKKFNPDQDIEVYSLRFPVPKPVEQRDPASASVYYQDGVKELKQYTYKELVTASKKLTKSYELAPDETVLRKLTLVNSLLLNYLNDMSDSIVVFNLLKSQGAGVELKSHETATAKAFFFHINNKNRAALKQIQDYLSLNEGVSSLLLSVYLKVAIALDDKKIAKDAFNKISNAPDQNVFSHSAQLEYFAEVAKNWDLYGEHFIKALTSHQKSVEILLHGANFYFNQSDIDNLGQILKRIKNLRYGENKLFYARFLQYQGLFLAYNNYPDDAMKSFKKSLRLHESDELRLKISSLSKRSKNNEINDLIRDSQVYTLLREAERLRSRKDYQSAMKLVIEALDLKQDHLEAKKLLALIEIDQGYFERGQKHLEDLRAIDPDNPGVVIALIKTFAKSYKIGEAKNLIRLVSDKMFAQYAEYASAVALYHQKGQDYLQAILWLHRAIKIHPLNDEYLARLGRIYLDNNKFSKARQLVLRAIELDPINIDYRIIYSEILYEMESQATAVGYLRSLLKENPDNTDILNQIAIFYYRNGQISSFEDLKKEIKDISQTSNKLFLYLMRAAALEDRYSDVIINAREFLESDPGNLEVRMMLAKTFMDLKRYDEAIDELKLIHSRASGYPELQYYRSKMFMVVGDYQQAMEAAELEVSNNPNSPFGHLVKGEILLEEEQYSLAEEQFKKVQKIDSHSVDALKGLAYIKFKKNQFDSAIDLYKKALKSKPDDADIFLKLGDVYRFKGAVIDSIENYETYLKLYPDAPDRTKIQDYINLMK